MLNILVCTAQDSELHLRQLAFKYCLTDELSKIFSGSGVCVIRESHTQNWRQNDFFSLGAMKFLMKAESDGGIPAPDRVLESVVFANDSCLKTKIRKM